MSNPGEGSGREIWRQAAAFASAAHAGDTRPDGRTPFFSHPARVALTVAGVFGCGDPETSAAALLHDVLEKTDATEDDVREAFGGRIAERVVNLSKIPPFDDEEAYLKRLAGCDWQTRLVKMADVLDNLDEGRGDLHHRVSKVRRALERLGYGDEPPMIAARARLTEALENAG